MNTHLSKGIIVSSNSPLNHNRWGIDLTYEVSFSKSNNQNVFMMNSIAFCFNVLETRQFHMCLSLRSDIEIAIRY